MHGHGILVRTRNMIMFSVTAGSSNIVNYIIISTTLHPTNPSCLSWSFGKRWLKLVNDKFPIWWWEFFWKIVTKLSKSSDAFVSRYSCSVWMIICLPKLILSTQRTRTRTQTWICFLHMDMYNWENGNWHEKNENICTYEITLWFILLLLQMIAKYLGNCASCLNLEPWISSLWSAFLLQLVWLGHDFL